MKGEARVTSARFAAQAGPNLGPEIGTDLPVLVPSYLGNYPELASDGAGFLSVQEIDARIRAVRVDGDGGVLDAEWLDLGAEGFVQTYPSVAFGGGRYLVTWSEFVPDSDDSSGNVIRGRLVNPDGTLEGDASFVLSSGAAIYSSVDWDGEHFLLAYLGLAGEGVNDVRSVLVNPDGTLVAGSEHTLTTSGSASNPRLAAGASSALVTWEEYVHSDTLGDTSTIHGVRIGGDGAPLDSASFALSTGVRSERSADVAASTAGFLVVWQDGDGTTVRGSIVSDAGAVTAEDFAISHGSDGAGSPSVAFDGTDYVVGWTDARDEQSLYGTQVSTAGSVAAEDTKLSSGKPRYVGFGSDHTNLAWNGSKLLLTYIAADPNGIEGSLLSPDLEIVKGTIPLSAIPNAQGYPRTAFDGENYVVAWTDERDSDVDMSVRAVRISGAGSVLDADGIAVSPPDKPGFAFELASARQGSTLFVWSGTDRLPQRRLLSGDATLGAVQPYATENDVFVPSLASNGSRYLAAFNTGGSSDMGSVIGQLIEQDGSPGAEFRIDASTLNTGPFVFASEGQFLVAYANSGMHLVSVSDTGAVGTVLDLTTNATYVSAASNGENTLIAWNDEVATTSALRGRFLTAGAFSGDAFELSAESAGYGSALAWDGDTYWAVWESPAHELVARSVGADGALGAVSTLVAEELYAPTLASDGEGQLLLSYAKLAGNRQSTRVVSRIMGRGADNPGGTGGAGGTGGSVGGSENEGGADTGTGGSNAAGSGGGSSAGTGAGGVAQGGSSTGGGRPSGGAMNGSAGSTSSGSGGEAGGDDDEDPTPRPARCSVGQVGAGEHGSGVAALLGTAWLLASARRRRMRAG